MSNYLKIVFGLAIICIMNACGEDTPTTPKNEPSKEEIKVNPDKLLFELMSSDQTGIDFANRITETHQLNIITNSYMYNGGGVAILDVNNDDLPDVYFTSSQESNKLYLNEGDFKFKDITSQAKVAASTGFKTGVTVIDINNDGFDDLYVCRTGMTINDNRRNLLFVNNQDNTFSEKAKQYGLDDISASNHANFFDYDLDGDLDMYLLNHPIDFKTVNSMQAAMIDGKPQRVSTPQKPYESDQFYRNDGGVFTNVSDQAGINNRGWGLSATVTDFNGDGYPDIYIGNDYIEPDYLYINNKRGGFKDQREDYMRHTSNHTMGVDIADYDNDTKVDLVALDMMAEDNPRQKALMTTMMTQRYNRLAAANYGHQNMRNVLQKGNPDGSFSDVGELAGIANTDWSWAALFGDYDNDGWKDLYITNGYRRDVTDLDYLNYTVDSLNKSGGITAARFPDFNDFLKLIPSNRLPNYIYQNNGDLTFEKQNNQWMETKPSFSNGAAYADLDKDGDLDLIVNNIADPAFVYRNKSTGQNYLQIKLKGTAKNKNGIGAQVWVKVGDQVQYQEMTPVRGFLSSVEPLLHFGLGKATKVDDVQIRWKKGQVQHLGEQTVNQRIVLDQGAAVGGKILYRQTLPQGDWSVKENTGINFTHKEDQVTDFDNNWLLPHAFSTMGPALAVGDLNGDGREDVFVGGGADQAAQVYLQTAQSTFKMINNGDLEKDRNREDNDAALVDIDGDNDLDLVVVSGNSQFQEGYSQNEDRIYINNGKGVFSRAIFGKTMTSASCVHPVDFDKDGDMDLVIGSGVLANQYPKAPTSFLLENNGGQYSDVTDTKATELKNIGLITEVTSADLNNDGLPEVILSGEWMPITVLGNENGRLVDQTANYGLDLHTGWWNCVTVVDIDGDKDLDLIAGNVGENSRLSPPLKVYAKDFDGNNQLDAVLTWMDNGKEYPLARREGLAKQMPMLNKKFKYFKPYSVATINQIFSAKEMEGAIVLEANELSSCWFENKGGSFIKHRLPTEAQLAPIHDIAVDENGQVLAIGNDYGPDTETGRMDASNGALMSLDNGAMKIIPQRGFMASKEARQVKLLQLANGQTMAIIANNGGPIECFVRK